MECRTLEITVISAKDIKDVNLFSKMDVYAVVMIAGDERSRQKTPVDKDGGKSPKWKFHMKFTVNEELAQQNRLTLHFTLKSERTLGDKDIGEVHVPIKELLDSNGDGKTERELTYSVRKSSGKEKGKLNFSYKFGEKFVAAKVEEPVMAYPAAAKAGTSSAYAAAPPPPGAYYAPPPGMPAYPPPHAAGYPPPPMAGYGYPPPPHGGYPQAAPGYGYPPPPSGYGYPPPQMQQPQKKKKNNNLGLGLGAGLLGGLLIGDMVSDVGEMGAYDAGFDDAGGFDF
ncbi:hypothetical protein L1049_020622 [Liquidambar formosana]|uniref:C2 domain-containing protein n=1 Tax=Liquidambar formosana TaxID=63359 RepID=A0AAP0XAV5_LIQFO